MEPTIEQLKYPIGKVVFPTKITSNVISDCISVIENHPNRLNNLVKKLTDEQLDTPYRKNGWTVRQVIHHLGDSHTNSYIRFKWTLTEKSPIIKAYDEVSWAELSDTKHAPIEHAILFLKALHTKWVYLLKNLSTNDLKKYFIHPENNNKVSLEENLIIYAWHCEHHYQHIKQLLIRKDWKND